MNVTLRVWRQYTPDAPGRFVEYDAPDIESHASFLEMLDIVNERLIDEGKEPVTFDHDCREGICGSCGLMINGQAHGPEQSTTTCQLHMREYRDGDELWIRAVALSTDGSLSVRRSASGLLTDAVGVGRRLAEEMLLDGADRLEEPPPQGATGP